MADESGLSPYVFACEGGLVLDQPTFKMQPGMALELENFEPDVRGGYRRINGYIKWNSNIVPQTSSSSEAVLMSAFFPGNNKVIAARGEKVFEAGTTGSWTEIDTGRTNANRYTFFRYNLAGTDRIIWADGANHATKYDGTTVTDLNATGAPANPKFITGFQDALFFAGHSANPEEIIFTAPFTDSDFSTANGAGSLRIDSQVTALFPFRNELIIFGEERIYRLTGNTIADFVLQPVTRDIGCLNGFTVQELGGDILFLGRDGLRTVAGTERINDVELGTVSGNVKELFDDTDVDEFVSVVVPGKTQYRLFRVNRSEDTQATTKGVIAVRKQQGYEFYDLEGINRADAEAIIQSEEIDYSSLDGPTQYKVRLGGNVTVLPTAFCFFTNPLLHLMYSRFGSNLAKTQFIQKAAGRFRTG